MDKYKYIDVPLIYNYSHTSSKDISGLTNLYLNSKSKEIGNYKCHSCDFNNKLILYKNSNLLFDNSLMHHVVTHNYKPDREILDHAKKKFTGGNKIKIKATFSKENHLHKFILDRNQILILDSLMGNSASNNNPKDSKKYIDKAKKFRYSEHAGLLDFEHRGLEKILISGKTNRQDKDDPEILLPQNMPDALDYEFMFHTHPPTPYPGARAAVGVLYEFPSMSDIFHFIEHYNFGKTQGSLIIAPEGMYIIHSTTGEDKIIVKDPNVVYKNLVNESFDIQLEAIQHYGKDYLKNDIFYTKVINDLKYINHFNKLLKKYLDDQVYVEYIPRIKDENGNYIVDKLIIELKPIERSKAN
jgi:hypothetical protein